MKANHTDAMRLAAVVLSDGPIATPPQVKNLAAAYQDAIHLLNWVCRTPGGGPTMTELQEHIEREVHPDMAAARARAADRAAASARTPLVNQFGHLAMDPPLEFKKLTPNQSVKYINGKLMECWVAEGYRNIPAVVDMPSEWFEWLLNGPKLNTKSVLEFVLYNNLFSAVGYPVAFKPHGAGYGVAVTEQGMRFVGV